MSLLLLVLIFCTQQSIQMPIGNTRTEHLDKDIITHFDDSKIDHSNVAKLKFSTSTKKNNVFDIKSANLEKLDLTSKDNLPRVDIESSLKTYIENYISPTTINVGVGEKHSALPSLYESDVDDKQNTLTNVIESTNSSNIYDTDGISPTLESVVVGEKMMTKTILYKKEITKSTKLSEMINTIKKIIKSIYDEMSSPVIVKKNWSKLNKSDLIDSTRTSLYRNNGKEKRDSIVITSNITTSDITFSVDLGQNTSTKALKSSLSVKQQTKILKTAEVNNISNTSFFDIAMINKKSTKKPLSAAKKTMNITKLDGRQNVNELNFKHSKGLRKRSKQRIFVATLLNDSFITNQILEAIATEKPLCENCKKIEPIGVGRISSL